MKPTLTGTFVVVLAAAMAPAASAAVSCSFTPVSGIVQVSMTDDGSDDLATIDRNGDLITVNGSACRFLGLLAATVNNTERIVVTGSNDFEQVSVPSNLAPGRTPEAGVPEIEVDIDLGPNPHSAPPNQAVILRGTTAADLITVGAAGANINGDDDADVTIANVVVGQVEWALYSGDGNDVVTGMGGAGTGEPTESIRMVIVGGLGDDTLTGGRHDYDALLGGPGNDTLDGAHGVRDSVNYNGESGPVTVDLAAGTGTGPEGSDTLVGIESAAGTDCTEANTQCDDILRGSDVSNVLRGLGGADTLEGGGGNDILWGDTGKDVIDGGPDNDMVSYEATAPGPVEIDISAKSAVFPDFPEENETFTDIESARGGPHDDVILGDDNANNLEGTQGIDIILGFGGDDVILGGTGSDALSGGAGNDRIIPDDTRYGPDQGSDIVHGGSGVDTLDYSFVPDPMGVIIDLAGGTAGGAAGSDTVAEFENVTGSPFNDRISGDGGANRLMGLAGEDRLLGLGGDDHLDGGEGTDTCEGGGNAGDVVVNCP